jgi:hypothetical protein
MILMGIFEAIIKNDLKLRFFEPSCESLFGSKARGILFEENQEMPPDPSFPNQKTAAIERNGSFRRSVIRGLLTIEKSIQSDSRAISATRFFRVLSKFWSFRKIPPRSWLLKVDH